MMDWSSYIEKEIIGKRFILAILIIAYFVHTGNGEGIVGTVIGYYFGTHQVGGSTSKG